MNEWITIATYSNKEKADEIVTQLSAQGISAKVVMDETSKVAPNFCVAKGYKVQVMDDTIGDIDFILSDGSHLAS